MDSGGRLHIKTKRKDIAHNVLSLICIYCRFGMQSFIFDFFFLMPKISLGIYEENCQHFVQISNIRKIWERNKKQTGKKEKKLRGERKEEQIKEVGVLKPVMLGIRRQLN